MTVRVNIIFDFPHETVTDIQQDVYEQEPDIYESCLDVSVSDILTTYMLGNLGEAKLVGSSIGTLL
jgi:hypothetical protein